MSQNPEYTDFNIVKKEDLVFSTHWSVEDQEFVGTCLPFFSLSWLDPDEEKALQGIKKLVFDFVDILQQNRHS